MRDGTEIASVHFSMNKSAMNPRESEADARVVIDAQLRQAGWNPADKSMVETEIPVAASRTTPELSDYSPSHAFRTHAPVYDLLVAADSFGPDRAVGPDSEELGWIRVPDRV